MTETLAEYNAVMVECLVGKGVAASIDGTDVQIVTRADTAEEQLAETAWSGCIDQLATEGHASPFPAVPTAGYWAGLYDYYLTLANCLEERGHHVPEPPSKETFVEAEGMLGSVEDAWYPYMDIDPDAIGLGNWNTLVRECPQEYIPLDDHS